MIVRSPRPDRGFTILDNLTLRDPRLSWKARGLLAFLLSMPDNWRTNSDHLQHCGPDGRDSVRAGLRELEAAGYLERRKVRSESGRWSSETVVYDRPRHPQAGERIHPSMTDNPAPESQALEEVPMKEDLEKDLERYSRLCPGCNGFGMAESHGTVAVCPMCRGGRVVLE